jgi:hypothetical protein
MAAAPLTISDAAFASGMRHRLGLSQMPPGALVVACDCAERRPPPTADHAMVCNARTKGMTMRLVPWRRIAHRAGVATAVEPAMERLRAGTERASLERGDMLVVLLDEALVVTDVSVVNPAANSFFQRAAHRAGAAASLRDASKFRKYSGSGQVAGGSFTPLSLESYGHLGRPGMQLLQTLAAAATSSATAGSDVTTSSFVTGALRRSVGQGE